MNKPSILPKKSGLFFLALILVISVFGQSTDYPNRKMLLRDEGLSQLSYVDLANPSANWYLPVPAGRDMQLVGGGRVLIGTGNGYEEREITTGNKVSEMAAFAGTLTAHRLRNGHTLLSGLNWQGKQGIVLLEVDANGTVFKTVAFAGGYPRLVRETNSGTFMITSDDSVFEGTKAGEVIWRAAVASKVKPHVWQALRLANGNTVVSGGYSANLQFFSPGGKLIDSITGPASVNPHFFSGLQILQNGHFVVANWQGHGPKFGASGVQLLEYTPDGKLAWSWKQDPEKYSSLQAVIILDGLDTKYLHVENEKGMLAPVK